jgi:RNA polymerase primary sigma factor
MAKIKKKPAKKTPPKAKAKARPAVKKAAKKPATKKTTKKTAKKVAKPVAASKANQKKSVALKSSASSSKPAAPALDKKSAKPFTDEERQKSLFSQPGGASMLKDADLEDDLGDDDVDLAVEADEDVEEELTLDADDEEADFTDKREGLLDDADDYHTP